MNNYFVAEQFPTEHENVSLRNAFREKFIRVINKGIHRLKPGYSVMSPPNPLVDMTTVEQRINYFHLLDAVIANRIPGEVVELGCFTGQCALLFQQVIQMHQSEKTLHLYDSFEVKFSVEGEVEQKLLRNFERAHLPLPVLHKGYFENTLPTQLPKQIAFVHIDCGFGGDISLHKDTLLFCLHAVYPKMAPGSVCVLMDYYDDTQRTVFAGSLNPGVKLACDEFFHSKPEKIVSLYGNQYAHGFFRKV
ncbi:TylF/MycF family methyltransferase [Hymenobacter aerilatus]|uniref:TylF/MycF family methyltransferase n=1 Tax=Hymenobacter aerilatus TaxID=2932251 RepID=A0A8T9T313_9BACT|nr:TylF/MycF/NovP-related O-methyltransferase [Hymenobacter aerilatus]UOR06496.1 TylF/MycF family methyltransferase [Hymenobacter aerilatus]